MKKTKIVCTLGPASNEETIIEQLILAGMDAARFNFSHGTHETHLASSPASSTYGTAWAVRWLPS